MAPFATKLRPYTLHVRSAVAGEEASVRAALLCDGASEPLRFIERETPFSVDAEACALSAVIRRESGAERIEVELVGRVSSAATSEAPRVVSSATGRTILLGDGLVPSIPRFVRGG